MHALSLLTLVAPLFPLHAALPQEPTATAAAARDDARDDARMAWWRDARFGLFIHWGLYAIPAGRFGEETDYGEWILESAQIPVSEYERFVRRFDPVDFDADLWVALAKDAGMRYVVITSKHHDGFCLFDSDATDYDVASTPFGRDVLRELAAACERAGLSMCWYHSIMDWHHPDYLPRRGWEGRSAEGADFDRYVEYLSHQVEELLTRYGPIGVMWFDGEWEATWTPELGHELYDLCRGLQPDVIVNNRVGKGRGGMAGMTADDSYAGDFGTPEQEIPAEGLPGVDWEACMTMNRHWGFNALDDDWKSTEELVRMLVDSASKGGNFLLNVGPTARGTIPEASVERLRGIGRWMRTNAEAIHGTSASPLEGLPWGRATVRRSADGARLYLHVFEWPTDGLLAVPNLGSLPGRAALLADPARPIAITRGETGVTLALGALPPDPLCSVVALDVPGALVVYETPRIEAPVDRFVGRLAVELATRSGGQEIRYTLDGSDPGVASPLYAGPIVLTESSELRARSFAGGRARSSVAARRFERVAPAPARALLAPVPGVTVAIHAGSWDVLPDFGSLAPVETRTVAAPELLDPTAEHYGLSFEGYVRIPESDAWVFALTSDDGARLWIDGELVVDNDGLHSAEERRGASALAAGWHAFRVGYFNKTGGAELALQAGRVGAPLGPLRADAWAHERVEDGED